MKTIRQTLKEMQASALKKHRSVAAWLKSAGVAQSTYYRWLGEKPTAPSTKTLARLQAQL